MTILNWRLQPDRAVVLSDTLSFRFDLPGTPAAFILKSFPLPHLQAVVAANGNTVPIGALLVKASFYELKDMDHYAGIAGQIIRIAHQESPLGVIGQKGTVVLIGWSPAKRRVAGWVWRHERDFETEALVDGEELHPAVVPGASLDGALDKWFALALEQQAAAERKREQRFIGGHLVAHEIIARPYGGVIVQTQTIGKLAHFEDDWATVEQMSPERVAPTPERWKRCEAWLAAAQPSRGIEFCRRAYELGAFILIDGPNAAVLAEFGQLGTGKMLEIFLGGGSLREILTSIMPRAELMAASNLCSTIIVSGRKGWGRALRPLGYRLMGTGRHAAEWITMKSLAPLSKPTEKNAV